MKTVMILMLITLVSLDSMEKGCLESTWNSLTDSYAHKKFDIEHDLNKNGRYFSCDSFLTPFEISSFLEELKHSIINDEKTAAAKIIDYPLDISFKNNSMLVEDYELTIKTEDELVDKFDEIFTSRFKALLSCSKIQNVFSIPSQGVFLGHGELIFSLDFDSTKRNIRVTKVSVNENSIDKWLSNNSCKSVAVH